jgi:hypothetical protein
MSELSKIANKAYLANLRSPVNETDEISGRAQGDTVGYRPPPGYEFAF